MIRSALVLVVLVALTGCSATTRVVDRTDAAAVARLDADVRARRAEISLASGERTAGRVRFVRLDSTAWDAAGAFRAVPTAAVFSIATDTRARRARSVRRGALIGAGVGLGLAAAAAFYPDQFGETAGAEFAFSVGLATVPLGALFGALGGTSGGERVEHVFTGGPPGPSE